MTICPLRIRRFPSNFKTIASGHHVLEKVACRRHETPSSAAHAVTKRGRQSDPIEAWRSDFYACKSLLRQPSPGCTSWLTERNIIEIALISH